MAIFSRKEQQQIMLVMLLTAAISNTLKEQALLVKYEQILKK